MRIAPVALAAAAAVLLLMCAVAGVLFLGAAMYLGIATAVKPAYAALITAAALLAPLVFASLLLLWRAHRRRRQHTRRRRELQALRVALQASARSDPYGFVTAAFVSGVLLSSKSDTRLRMAQFMELCGGLGVGG
ncbi:MAG: hypothetical protein KGL13_03260 [Gammaproteobacteria bacterium]|nr:hypothetical protein [Gammaproteobacteria bacterium]